jgi:hypothetical protein
MVLLLAKKNTLMTNRELAEHIGRVDDAAVAQAGWRLEKRIQEGRGLARRSRSPGKAQKRHSAVSLTTIG